MNNSGLPRVKMSRLLKAAEKAVADSDLNGAYDYLLRYLSLGPQNRIASALQDKIIGEFSKQLYLEDIAKVKILRGQLVPHPCNIQEVFRKTISTIQIETSSYCNRRCSYCPVSSIKKRTQRSKIQYMPMSLFKYVISDLRRIEYSGRIILSRFNEPLSDSLLFKRLRYVRNLLPNAALIIFTNGDLLTRKCLDSLHETGCNYVRISHHVKEDSAYYHDVCKYMNDVEQEIQARAKRLKLESRTVKKIPGSYEAEILYPGKMRVIIVGRNYYDSRLRISRGGKLGCSAIKPRISPCLYPFHSMDIEYDGTVMPCCNLLYDYNPHKDARIGCITEKEGTLFENYGSEAAVNFRSQLLNFKQKKPPCSTCYHLLIEDKLRFKYLIDNLK